MGGWQRELRCTALRLPGSAALRGQTRLSPEIEPDLVCLLAAVAPQHRQPHGLAAAVLPPLSAAVCTPRRGPLRSMPSTQTVVVAAAAAASISALLTSWYYRQGEATTASATAAADASPASRRSHVPARPADADADTSDRDVSARDASAHESRPSSFATRRSDPASATATHPRGGTNGSTTATGASDASRSPHTPASDAASPDTSTTVAGTEAGTGAAPSTAPSSNAWRTGGNGGGPPRPEMLSRALSSGVGWLADDVRVLSDSRLLSLLDSGGFFGADIGGTLTKLTFFEPDDVASSGSAGLRESMQRIHAFIMATTRYGHTGQRDAHQSFHAELLRGTFHFIRFSTSRIAGAVDLVLEQKLNLRMSEMYATGGGAFKYAPLFKEKLGVDLVGADELACCVRGLTFCLGVEPNEAFTYEGRDPSARPVPRDLSSSAVFPFILVNVGSGVSILHVKDENTWGRVSGTSVGGGTYFGLSHLLTGSTDFDEMLDLAERGDNAALDLCVGDIYGGNYSKFNLKSSTIASSFGKVGHTVIATRAGDERASTTYGTASSVASGASGRSADTADSAPSSGGPGARKGDAPSDDDDDSAAAGAGTGTGAASEAATPAVVPPPEIHTVVRPEDASRALLLMVSNVIGQAAYLNALHYDCPRVFFAGNFLRHNNSVAMRSLAYSIRFWSKNRMEGLFLKHEGYFGAIGAFLETLESARAQSPHGHAARPRRESHSGKTSLHIPSAAGSRRREAAPTGDGEDGAGRGGRGRTVSASTHRTKARA